jgi:hypothetical protein
MRVKIFRNFARDHSKMRTGRRENARKNTKMRAWQEENARLNTIMRAKWGKGYARNKQPTTDFVTWYCQLPVAKYDSFKGFI